MKNRHWILLLAMLLMMVPCALSQHYSSSNSKAIKQFEKGQSLLYQGHSSEAISCFEQALSFDPSFCEANILLAEWYLDGEHFDMAKQYYYATVKANPTFYTQAWLQLGELELRSGQYPKAVENYNRFLELDKKNPDRHPAARLGIQNAQFRMEALKNPIPFSPQNMGANINSQDDEYLPALTVDGKTLIFTRRFPRTPKTIANTPEEEDFYISTFEDGQWTKAQRMKEPVNSFDNEGAQCISQDGRVMFFTACGRSDGGGRCDIYMCIRKGNSWSKPRNLGPNVNSGAWESQPSFSIDGKTLYFVSDRKGGYGGLDIWKTTFQNGQWTTPQNLGPTINTPGDEQSPFIHYDDKTLYFSSNGHVGMGGLDLFKSQKDSTGKWQKPVNLGYPINTSGDETNLIVSADAHTAIYSSNSHNGFGKQDLFSFELPQADRPLITVCMKGKVYDQKTGNPLSAVVKIINITTGNEVASTSCDPQTGEYIVSLPSGEDYAVHVDQSGYLFYSQNFDLEEGLESEWKWEPTILDIALKPIEVGESVALRNVFFETNQYALLEESQVELNKVVDLLKKNPSIKIELSGHTDNTGNPSANMKLSEQRAKAVYDYLVEKGIEASRLSYKGYGDSKPIADNNSEDGRAQNRRTMFTILQK